MDISTSTFLEGCYYELGDCIADYEEQSVFEARVDEMFKINLAECVSREALQESFEDIAKKIKATIESLIEKFYNFIQRVRGKALIGAVGMLESTGKKLLEGFKDVDYSSQNLDDEQVILAHSSVSFFKNMAQMITSDVLDNNAQREKITKKNRADWINAIKSNKYTDEFHVIAIKSGKDVVDQLRYYYSGSSIKDSLKDIVNVAQDAIKVLKDLLKSVDRKSEDRAKLKGQLVNANRVYTEVVSWLSAYVTSMKRLNKSAKIILKKAGKNKKKETK